MATTRGRNSGLRRHDAPGHFDPNYARGLLAKSGNRRRDRDVAVAFPHVFDDDLADELGSAFLESAVRSSHAHADHREAVDEAELGGPFVTTSAREELATGVDPSNPEGSFREPFPRAMATGSEGDDPLLEG
jgi:hypothetical protein